jgi:hypothetical protein
LFAVSIGENLPALSFFGRNVQQHSPNVMRLCIFVRAFLSRLMLGRRSGSTNFSEIDAEANLVFHELGAGSCWTLAVKIYLSTGAVGER